MNHKPHLHASFGSIDCDVEEKLPKEATILCVLSIAYRNENNTYLNCCASLSSINLEIFFRSAEEHGIAIHALESLRSHTLFHFDRYHKQSRLGLFKQL
jgi:hypothetical protein